MPELPDLTIYAKNLKKLVLRKRISSAEVFNRAKVNATPEDFRAALSGSEITDITREGKELLFSLSNSRAFSVHLMLFGKFSVAPYLDLHKTFSKVIAIGFMDDTALLVSDAKGMAKVTLDPALGGGPDALSDAFTFAYFQSVTRKKAGMNIKALLIDQKILRGIGNAYVDEILYAADISPKSIAGKIPEDALRRLYDAIPMVMREAIGRIEAISPDIISGEERGFLRVHNPRRRQTEAGEPILCEEVCKKRTYFTEKQKLYI